MHNTLRREEIESNGKLRKGILQLRVRKSRYLAYAALPQITWRRSHTMPFLRPREEFRVSCRSVATELQIIRKSMDREAYAASSQKQIRRICCSPSNHVAQISHHAFLESAGRIQSQFSIGGDGITDHSKKHGSGSICCEFAKADTSHLLLSLESRGADLIPLPFLETTEEFRVGSRWVATELQIIRKSMDGEAYGNDAFRVLLMKLACLLFPNFPPHCVGVGEEIESNGKLRERILQLRVRKSRYLASAALPRITWRRSHIMPFLRPREEFRVSSRSVATEL
ncbi:hypothetical protein CEXT_347841 [Caerostris extrusa]|uniref:Uncharacterized protein n=1 Tax=Caerostris extrusa TaxID=172846 RepID=A0AAV4URR1_CAEEX|nr:hypothetical protein CEXT_347841 [Caerostris extrusa]